MSKTVVLKETQKTYKIQYDPYIMLNRKKQYLSDLKGKIETGKSSTKKNAATTVKMTTPIKVLKEMMAIKSHLDMNDSMKDKWSDKKVVTMTNKLNALKLTLSTMPSNNYMATYKRFTELSGSLTPLTKEEEAERKALRKVLYAKVTV